MIKVEVADFIGYMHKRAEVSQLKKSFTLRQRTKRSTRPLIYRVSVSGKRFCDSILTSKKRMVNHDFFTPSSDTPKA